MINCFRSKGQNTDTRTLWTNLRGCRKHVGKHMNFVTRDGLEALFCFNWGLKKQILVYIDEK